MDKSPPSADQRVVIVGAGQAGFAHAAKLRGLGIKGPILLVGEECFPPYRRPPLSKAYVAGKLTPEQLLFRPLKFYEERNIDLYLGFAAVAVNWQEKALVMSDGRTLCYDKLVFATGARVVRLPTSIGGALKGVHYVRTIADADCIAVASSPAGQS